MAKLNSCPHQLLWGEWSGVYTSPRRASPGVTKKRVVLFGKIKCEAFVLIFSQVAKNPVFPLKYFFIQSWQGLYLYRCRYQLGHKCYLNSKTQYQLSKACAERYLYSHRQPAAGTIEGKTSHPWAWVRDCEGLSAHLKTEQQSGSKREPCYKGLQSASQQGGSML